MARSVKPWIGKTDDSNAPPRVRQRVIDASGGICHFCKQPIQTGQPWALDHVRALINGGGNVESNLGPIHVKPCHQIKTASDVAIKAKVAATRQKHTGAARPAGKIPSRAPVEKPKRDRLPVPPPKILFERNAR